MSSLSETGILPPRPKCHSLKASIGPIALPQVAISSNLRPFLRRSGPLLVALRFSAWLILLPSPSLVLRLFLLLEASPLRLMLLLSTLLELGMCLSSLLFFLKLTVDTVDVSRTFRRTTCVVQPAPMLLRLRSLFPQISPPPETSYLPIFRNGKRGKRTRLPITVQTTAPPDDMATTNIQADQTPAPKPSRMSRFLNKLLCRIEASEPAPPPPTISNPTIISSSYEYATVPLPQAAIAPLNRLAENTFFRPGPAARPPGPPPANPGAQARQVSGAASAAAGDRQRSYTMRGTPIPVADTRPPPGVSPTFLIREEHARQVSGGSISSVGNYTIPGPNHHSRHGSANRHVSGQSQRPRQVSGDSSRVHASPRVSTSPRARSGNVVAFGHGEASPSQAAVMSGAQMPASDQIDGPSGRQRSGTMMPSVWDRDGGDDDLYSRD